jgi:putative sterol carrier protein
MGPTLDHFRGAAAEEVGAFFAESDPLEVVEAVRATSDDHLLELIGRDDVRPLAVAAIVSRMHEYAVPERLAAIEGVVRFDLERGGELLERHGLVFDRGALRHLPDIAADQAVDVVLRTSVLRFVRMVSGERNAGLEFLAGKLDLDGDAELALGIGGLFRVPGTGDVAVDPKELDPVDVATALKGTKSDHLRKVMASGFRPIVLDEIFRRLPAFVNHRKARAMDLTIGFRLEGRPDGEVDRYVVRIVDGAATVTAGAEEGSERDATVTCEAHEFLRLATGHLGAVTGVLRGQLKVRGDRAKALQLSSVIEFPRAR